MKNFLPLVFLIFSIFITGCASSIESISMSYPSGLDRILVKSNGEAFLFFGVLMPERIKKDIFNVEELRVSLKGRLFKNLPTERWPDPNAIAGMVTFRYLDKTEKDFLIFNEEKFAEVIFKKAKENIIKEEDFFNREKLK